MSATFLQLKNKVANTVSRTDGGTPDTIRDNAINDAVRDDIACYYPFSFLRATTTVTTDANGQADLPADYNASFDPYRIYDGTAPNTNDSDKINQSVLTRYGNGDRKYFVDWNASAGRYRLNSTEQSVTLNLVYYFVPPIMTADADVCVVPDNNCITYLGAARVWLSDERDETNHDRFKTLGLRQLQQMVQNDKTADARRMNRSSAFGFNLGWNVRH